MLWYNSANRDERVFADPTAFDVTRPLQPQQVGFGAGGPHFCLGANLARREITVMFDELRRRLPDLRDHRRARLPAERLHQRHQAHALRLESSPDIPVRSSTARCSTSDSFVRLNVWPSPNSIDTNRVIEAWPVTKRSHSHGTGSRPNRWHSSTPLVPAWANTAIRRCDSSMCHTGSVCLAAVDATGGEELGRAGAHPLDEVA